MAPFNRLHMSFYWRSRVNMALSYIVSKSDILVENRAFLHIPLTLDVPVKGDTVGILPLYFAWSNEIRYLGAYIVQSRQFKCSLDYAKKSFFRSLNAIFGKIGRNASEEVILEIIRSKCIPILIYGLECFALTKSDLKSLAFAVNRFLMKLFPFNNTEIIEHLYSPDICHDDSTINIVLVIIIIIIIIIIW